MVEDTFKFLLKCPYEKPHYDKNTPDSNGYFICSDNFFCNDNKYFLDGECVDKDLCISKNKIYIQNNICLKEYPTRSKYKKYNDIYLCKDCENGEFIFSDKECVDRCPKGFNFVGNDSKCRFICRNEDGLKYYELEKINEPDNQYTIFKCINQCQGQFHLKSLNTNECYQSCPENYPYMSREENTYFDNCLSSTRNKYTLQYEDNSHNIISLCVIICREPKTIL